MMLRNMRDPVDGSVLENKFEAVDERTGERICAGSVEAHMNAQMYPAQPLRVRIRLQGAIEDQMTGALLGCARGICTEAKVPARIYVSCAPDNAALVDYLATFGFRDNDGQVRMRCDLRDPDVIGKLPAGCVMVHDHLELPEEREFFLERYNNLYGTAHDLEWLDAYTDRDDFMRILAVAPTGLVNETIVWREGDVGVVGYTQTARRWRRKSVAREMLHYAARYFVECGLEAMASIVHVSVPGLLQTFESAGFYQEKLLLRYPGMDVK